MISLETVEREISELEARETSYKVCERLAWLYIVRDHLIPQSRGEQGIMPKMDGSEFLKLCSGKSVRGVMGVMDEYVQTLAITYPTTYNAIMDKVAGTQ